MKNRTPKIHPTQDDLHRLFRYDEDSGHLIWRERPAKDFPTKRAFSTWNARYSNRPAGGTGRVKYLQTMVNGQTYMVHRLVWLWRFGEIDPRLQIDHIDGNGLNNRPDNLRLVTPADNNKNQKRNSRNSSGFKGVYWHKSCQKWVAQVRLGGKTRYIGIFSDIKEAAEAAAKFYRESGFSERHIDQ